MAGRVAIVASVLTALGLGLLAFHDPGVAERLTAEDGAIEWIQVLLCAAALLISVPSARSCYSAGRPIMFDVLILTGLAAIVIGEVDLDKRIFGVKIIATRFFVDQHIFLPYRMLAASRDRSLRATKLASAVVHRPGCIAAGMGTSAPCRRIDLCRGADI
jgi:hypothetical protein